MKRLLRFLITYQLKVPRSDRKSGGFTLIELLVGLVLAFLIITPLLGFVVNMMNTERQEKAKATSEQEIQAALDYIARDVDQAFFIYDGLGLNQVKTQLPQVPNGEPVLVFWKRQLFPKRLPINRIGIGACNGDPNSTQCDDAFVYSLVAYYLIRDTTCNNDTWSCTARIGRVQLNSAVKNVNNNPNEDVIPASPGFDFQFERLQGSSIEEKLNSWTNAGGGINGNQPQILIDYIDQSTGADVPNTDGASNCSIETRPQAAERPDNRRYPRPYWYRQVPVYRTSPDPTGAVDPQFATGSFYACVNTDQTIARVFIRGNALARTRPKSNPPTYVASQPAFFPKQSIQAQGRGLINDSQ